MINALPMNVIFLQKHAGRGGSKNSLAESLAAIVASGEIRPRVIASETGRFTERCDELGVPVTIAPLPEWRKFGERLRFPSAIRSLVREFAPWRPDWIISNEMWWAPHAHRLAAHLGCRSAVILRDGIATVRKSLQYQLDRHDLILPVSSTIAGGLATDARLAGKTHVLFNSVSVAAEGPDDAARLDALLAPHADVRRWLLVIGKLSSRKNQADAVRVTRALIDAGHTDLGLLLAGDIDPGYLPEMKQTIAAARLDDRVAMIGNFDGVAALLRRADTLLLPSFREGLPRSLVESITVGVPAFSFPCEGVEDIYGVHQPRFVSTENTAESLFSTIHAAWSDRAAMDLSFAKVRGETLSRFSPEAHHARLLELLRHAGPKMAESVIR